MSRESRNSIRRDPPSSRTALAVAFALGALAFAPAVAPAAVAGSGEPFVVIHPLEKKLANGLEVLVIPDTRLDLVHLSLRVPAGVAAEPPSLPGIAGVTAQLLRAGTTLRDANRFAADVDQLGGSFAAAAGREYATVGMTVLAKDAEDAFSLVSDAVLNPFFAETEVRRVSTLALSRLVQAHDDAAATADEQAWTQALPGHPAARSPFGSIPALRGLGRDPVRAFHRDRYRPDRATLVVAGNLPPERAFALAEEWFGRWSGHTADPLPVASPPATRRVVIFDRPGVAASELRLAVPVPGRRAPDRLARGFGAELLEQRLQRAGAAGRVRASMQLLRDQGLWIAATSVTPDSAAAAAARLRRTLEDFVAQPPTAAAVRDGARILRARFPLGFETLAGAASQWQLADFDGEPRDAFDTFAARVSALSPTDIQAALRRELDFNRATLVAVGPAAALRPALERFGPVEVIPMRDALEMSAPAQAVAEATAEEAQKGRGILALALEVHGGADRLRGITDSIVDQDATFELQGETTAGHLRYVRKEPFRLKLETTMEKQVTRQVLNGREAWSLFPGDSLLRVADTTDVNDLRAAFLSDPIHLMLEASTPVTRVAWRGRETIDGHEADRVDTAQPDDTVKRFYFDAKTRRLLAVDVVEPILQIVAPARWLYRDWREVQGVWWPYEEKRLISGQPYMTLRTVSIQINPGVKDAEFVAPSSMRLSR